MIRFDDPTILVLVVDNGSLSTAVCVLNTTPAATSAAVRRLEAEFGVRLPACSTRNLALMQEGERYLQHARRALVDLQAGQDALTLGRQTIGDDVSLSIPSDFGCNVLTGWLDDFLTEHSTAALRVHIDDQLVGMFRQRVDATVRYDEPGDPSLVALSLAPDSRHMLCATPTYFMRHDVPKTPDDLRRHNCLLLALSDTTHNQWTSHGVSGDGQAHVIRVTGDRIADDGGFMRRWAVAGHGIIYKS